MKHSVFQFNLEAICSLSKYSELPKKDSHLKYNLEKIFFKKRQGCVGTLRYGLHHLWKMEMFKRNQLHKLEDALVDQMPWVAIDIDILSI